MNKSLGILKSRWYNIIETCVKEIGSNDVDWRQVAKMRQGTDIKQRLRMKEIYSVKVM